MSSQSLRRLPVLALIFFGLATPAWAAEKAGKAKAGPEPMAASAPAPAAVPLPPAPSKQELAQRSLKGVENQKAWVATLEKQLEDEKARLAQMEAEHAKAYPEAVGIKRQATSDTKKK